MVSVTPDTAVTTSAQPAPLKPAKAERSPAPDSFASMVGDSVAEVASSDRAPAARDQQAPRRWADDASSESSAPRDVSSSRARDHVDAAEENYNPAHPGPADASTDVQDSSKPGRSGATKTSETELDTKAKDTSDRGGATNSVSSTGDGLAVAASTVVAVAIPFAVASAAVSAASGPSVGAQSPLAIAAGALASSSAINGSPSASASSAGAALDKVTELSGLGNEAGKTAGLGSDAQANAGKTDAATATQPEAPSGVIATTDQAAATAAAATVAAKAGFNGSGASRPGSTGLRPNGDDSGTSLQSTDNAATAERSAIDGKSKTPGVIIAPKTETSIANAPVQLSNSSREHTAASATASAQADLSPPGIQAETNLQQPQLAVAVPNQLNVSVANSTAVPLNALGLQIAATAQSGKSRFEIRLDPAELGRIDVRIDIDRQGQMTSHLTVEKPETLAMLRQDAPQLQRALDDAGFKTGNGGLQFSLRDQSSSGQNSGNESARHAQRLIVSNEDTIPAITAGRTYGRMLASSGGVDIRV